MKFKDVENALTVFREAAHKHAETTETGDYKTGNKCHDKIVAAASFLQNNNALSLLHPMLTCDSVGVRLWAASYLLSSHPVEATGVLEIIAALKGPNAFSAEITLSEWRKGTLKMPKNPI